MCLFIVCLVFSLATNLDKSHIHLDFVFLPINFSGLKDIEQNIVSDDKLRKLNVFSNQNFKFTSSQDYKYIKQTRWREIQLTLWDKNIPNDDNFHFVFIISFLCHDFDSNDHIIQSHIMLQHSKREQL